MTIDEIKTALNDIRQKVRTTLETITDPEDMERRSKFLTKVEDLAESYSLDLAFIITDKFTLLNVYVSLLMYGIHCHDEFEVKS